MGRLYLVLPHLAFQLTSPWKSAPVIATLTLGGILILAFIWWERRTPYPIYPRSLFVEKVFPLDYPSESGDGVHDIVDYGFWGSQFLVNNNVLAS